MRVLDLAADETPAGGATTHTVADAKFSYVGGGHDDWGPGQAADQLTIHGMLAGGPIAAAIPRLTWHSCLCDGFMLKAEIEDRRRQRVLKSRGKRRGREIADAAEREAATATKAAKFIASADVKWVK
jgi:hypothetical protein